MSYAEKITRAKGGDWHGSYGRIPTPSHSPKDRGISIRDNEAGTDVILHCFNESNFDWKSIKDQWRREGFLPAFEREPVRTSPPSGVRPKQSAQTPKTRYVYRDAEGKPAFQMVRSPEKHFHVEHLDAAGRWAPGMNGVTAMPYRLPELLAAPTDQLVFICEGEKDVETVAALGLIATTNSNGAGKWRLEFATYLKGRKCVILPDNDVAGEAHANDVKAKLQKAGIDAIILKLPIFKPKGDVTDWIEAGGTARDLLLLTDRAFDEAPRLDPEPQQHTEAKSDKGSALPFEWFKDIEAQLAGLWLIKHFLPSVGLGLIYGHPGCGKSFLALDFALHVALGWPWNGRKVRQGLVVYVGAEGTSGLRNRIVAFRNRYDIPRSRSVPLLLIPTPIDLQAPDGDVNRLIETIRLAAAACGDVPVLIVVDTLSKTFGAGKENTDDMATYVGNCQRLSSEFSSCVIPVHHRPKDAESEEPRGHGSLKGGMDTVILVEAGKTKRVRVTKQKDAEICAEMAFNLVQVHLGTDEDGEPVTSCVVEQADATSGVVAKRLKLSDAQAVTFQALKRALADEGDHPPVEIPEELLRSGQISRVVTIAAWRSATLDATADPDRLADHSRRMFSKHRDRLQSIGAIGIWKDYVWLTEG